MKKLLLLSLCVLPLSAMQKPTQEQVKQAQEAKHIPFKLLLSVEVARSYSNLKNYYLGKVK